MARGTGAEVDGMTLKELTTLLAAVEAAIPERKKIEIGELRAKLSGIASEAGYTLDEVIGKKRGSLAGSSVVVKYRNPDNASETWSGRGRTARWLAEKLKKRGARLEDFAV